MITKDKIRKAAVEYAEEHYNDVNNSYMRCIHSFFAGAVWALVENDNKIKEMLKKKEHNVKLKYYN